MKSTAETYFDAALERLATAERLHREGYYATAHFFAGLAVECMLRAYLRRRTEEFESNHSLAYLAKRSGYYDIVPARLQVDYGIKFAEMNRRWLSHHRYFTEEQIRQHLHSIGADMRAKGSQFKQNSQTMLDIAAEVVGLGERKWRL